MKKNNQNIQYLIFSLKLEIKSELLIIIYIYDNNNLK